MRNKWLSNLTDCVAKVLKSKALTCNDMTVLSQCWANMFIFHWATKEQQRWNCVMYWSTWTRVSSRWSILHYPFRPCLSFSVSVLLLPTYPSPNPTTLTLPCYPLNVVGLGEGLVGSCLDTDTDPSSPSTPPSICPYIHSHIGLFIFSTLTKEIINIL